MGSCIILLLIFYSRYKIKNLKEIRAFYAHIRKKSDKPLIICSNHLTLIDSIIIAWSLASIFWYTFHFKSLPWNLPAVETVKVNFFRKLVAYLTKCILIDRDGSRDYHNRILNQTLSFLRRGEVLLIFPEGTRSRSSKLEMKNIKYGVGKIIQQLLPNCEVMLLYLTHNQDKKFSDYPPKYSHFTILTDLFQPDTKYKGFRGQRDITMQIIKRLKRLEDQSS